MMTPAQRGARTRKQDALAEAYHAKFPQFKGGRMTPAILRAMAVSLKTGIEQPALVEQRKEIEANMSRYDANLKREHARPFTPTREKQYTARIKNRELREGDCERPWQNYFAYRDAHPNDVEPLDAVDLAYAGQWTSCAVPARAS
jgi:phosphotransacetylase